MTHLHAFVVALMLLSRLPVPGKVMPKALSQSLETLSVLYFPLVGLTLALILCWASGVFGLLFPPFFAAALALALWVWINGALHLDGLADCIDVLAASHKTHFEKEKLLAIFKEPTIGVMAAVGIVLLLILKLSGIYELLQAGKGFLLVFILVWPRTLVMLYMLYTPRIRLHGLTADVALSNRRTGIWVITAGVFIGGLILFPAGYVVCAGAATVALLYWWRRLWLRKIDGFAGDCLGGFTELAELLLLAAALVAMP